MEYSILAWITFNVFSISSISIESKKIFNKYISIHDYIDYKYNLMIIDLRNRLDVDIVKVIECLKWWIKREFIKKKLNSLMIDEKENLINEDLIDENEDLIDEEEDLYEWGARGSSYNNTFIYLTYLIDELRWIAWWERRREVGRKFRGNTWENNPKK